MTLRVHILCVDDSGSSDNPNGAFFVLSGINVFERGLYHLIKAADDLVASFEPGDPHEIGLLSHRAIPSKSRSKSYATGSTCFSSGKTTA